MIDLKKIKEIKVKLSVLLLVLVGCSAIVFLSLNSRVGQPNPQEEDAEQLVARVSKLMLLPTNETPTVATIVDASKLTNNLDFADAKNGDRLLIYSDARKAILYDPVKNQIVRIITITIGDPSTP